MLKTQSVLIVGLGYVGLPLAALVASQKQYEVTGFDIDAGKIATIKKDKANWIDEGTKKLLTKKNIRLISDPESLYSYDIIVIAVPTPVDSKNHPDLQLVISASTAAAQSLKPKGLFILESTVNPGVCNEVIEPLLRATGKPYFFAHCPERIDPGNEKYPLKKVPRVVGADGEKDREKAYQFYKSFLSAPVKKVSSLQTAEATKIVENSFRDINIAFVNELARSFAPVGIDTLEVIEAASTKPYGFMAHYPGAGVGGHCIPVDPYYLIESAHQRGFEHRFLRLAREINSEMPTYTVELLKSNMKKLSLSWSETPILLLGLSYKPGIPDQRNSPALEIRDLLKKHKANFKVFDPLLPETSNFRTLKQALSQTKVVIIATAHEEFIAALENKTWPQLQLIIDGRNCLSHWPPGVQYRGIGR